MNFEVGSEIAITNPTKEVEQWCLKNLTIDNPDFYKKEKLGKWTGNTPRKLYLYETVGKTLYVPLGCLRTLWKMFPDKALWNSEFSPLRRFAYDDHIELYPYQEKAVEAVLKAKNGILVMPCGAGKTQCGLKVISRIGGRTLWLTHTQDLLNQSRKRAESILGNVGCGTITGGKINIGEGITFATIQTMAKINLSNYEDFWDTVIVDECQHCAGTPTRVTQFYHVMSTLNARYKIGLTATPKRADGLERSMFALLGEIIYEVSREEVKNTTCPISVQQINTGWYPSEDVLLWDGTIDYNKVIDELTNDEDRFNIILNFVNNCVEGSCIVLANRVSYLKNMNDLCKKKSICLSGMSKSKKAREERKEALRKLNDGEIDCIFATYQLAKEGLDVPSLNYIVLATPEKDETTIIQSVGRVGRKADNKKVGKVIDFVDDFGMYIGWYKKRVGYYRKIGACILDDIR